MVGLVVLVEPIWLQAASTDPRAKCGQDGLLLTKTPGWWWQMGAWGPPWGALYMFGKCCLLEIVWVKFNEWLLIEWRTSLRILLLVAEAEQRSRYIVDLDRFNSRCFFNDVRFFGAFYAIANSALKCTRFLCLDPPLNNVVGISWLDLSSVMDGLQAIDESQSNKVQVRRYPKNTSRKKWVHPKFMTLPDNI